MVKLFLIRHAESVSNKLKSEVFASFGLDPKDTKLCLAYKFVNNNEVVDALLSDLGKEQCQEARLKNAEKIKKISHVICSPLRRCLDTARRMLHTESIKQNGGLLKIRGEVREILCCQGDFPMMVKDSMKEFAEFDFEAIEKDVQDLEEFFFINYLENAESVDEIRKFARGLPELTHRDVKTEYMIDLLKKRLIENELLEKNYDIYLRVQKFKESLKAYVKEHDIKDGELAIVAHLRIIKSWTSTSFDISSDSYVGHIDPDNCAMIEVDLE